MYNLQTHIGFTNLWSNKPRFCLISSQRVKNGTLTPCIAVDSALSSIVGFIFDPIKNSVFSSFFFFLTYFSCIQFRLYLVKGLSSSML